MGLRLPFPHDRTWELWKHGPETLEKESGVAMSVIPHSVPAVTRITAHLMELNFV